MPHRLPRHLVRSSLKPCIGLVVPSLELGGGVPAVAGFLKKVTLEAGRYDLKIISLATSRDDGTSTSLFRPAGWWRGATVRQGQWQGLPYTHVGATLGDFEFQRYRSSKALRGAVAGCDILQVVCGSPAWANAVCGLGKPVSMHCATRAKVERRVRDSQPLGLRGWWQKAMTEITDYLDDRALRRADAIQVMNPWMYEYAQRLNHGRAMDLRQAPPGVDARVFSPAAGRDLQKDPYILCVGRLADPRKNIQLLLEAYAGLPEGERSRIRLVLAGKDAPPDHFWHRADALGVRDRITFVYRPSEEELVVLYQQAVAFALPSDEEGFGVVLLESMACGTPVISTRCGGPEDIITEGEDGFLVPRDDAPALGERIQLLCVDEELNRNMGRRARTTVEERFADTVAGQAFMAIWDRLLRQAGKD